MINIGCHLSSAGGFCEMARNAQKIGANTFQYFTRNPRGGKARPLDLKDIEDFLKIAKENNFKSIVAHAPYTLNLCSSAKHIREYSREMFADDIFRTNHIPGSYYNFHPGSHTGQGADVGIAKIYEFLNKVLKPNQQTVVLLETMAGKGSEVGGSFEELQKIIENVSLKDKIGVCFDTCHVFDAGYDIANDLEGVLEKFDKTVGITKIKAIHLNDSKNISGSKKDRHEKIDSGKIGLKALLKIAQNKHFKDLPFILETPQEDLLGYADEIALIKNSLKYEKEEQ